MLGPLHKSNSDVIVLVSVFVAIYPQLKKKTLVLLKGVCDETIKLTGFIRS